jgi:hypothetical protein
VRLDTSGHPKEEPQMICTLTARQLKPGAFDAFREAFEKAGIEDGPQEIVKRWSRVYVCRDVTDENVALKFGFFEGTLEELREIQRQGEGGPRSRPTRWRRTSRRSCSTAPTRSSRRSPPLTGKPSPFSYGGRPAPRCRDGPTGAAAVAPPALKRVGSQRDDGRWAEAGSRGRTCCYRALDAALA